MARNGSANAVAIRDEREHYLKGMPGGLTTLTSRSAS
jgi:hypothetical protein